MTVAEANLRLDAVESEILEIRRARWEVEYPPGHAERDARRPSKPTARQKSVATPLKPRE